ncbi:hypothetical protein [Roseateles asaccharophilus]|uniref:Uncharacterized protein n=1 Tax=Roseateles asaccharophilus TaxID=582607 RepID=A0ABU2A4J1_9BURK|nr:hypothetical protein [Roseateles asaccharophilus]MDR7332123.1 hypothetical protein [Roseateles asaccharophilus]
MSSQQFALYFAISPYGPLVPPRALEAAQQALEAELGGAHQVLAAKDAFERAGGVHALWGGTYTGEIARWTKAVQVAVAAAYRAHQPRQGIAEDAERCRAAFLDVVPATRYPYTPNNWLEVFTAHFGMTDYCDSHEEALAAGRRWLSVARKACPIAAAEQEIRDRCRVLNDSTSAAQTKCAATLPSLSSDEELLRYAGGSRA